MSEKAGLERRLTSLMLGRTAPDAAQAIIDEFGLEVREDRLHGGYRVIGKWKEDEWEGEKGE